LFTKRNQGSIKYLDQLQGRFVNPHAPTSHVPVAKNTLVYHDQIIVFKKLAITVVGKVFRRLYVRGVIPVVAISLDDSGWRFPVAVHVGNVSLEVAQVLLDRSGDVTPS
jgi:hypothetical protein